MRYIHYLTAEEAVRNIRSGNRVFLHGSAATPVHLINTLLKRHAELENVELVSITTLGDIHFDDFVAIETVILNWIDAVGVVGKAEIFSVKTIGVDYNLPALF